MNGLLPWRDAHKVVNALGLRGWCAVMLMALGLGPLAAADPRADVIRGLREHLAQGALEEAESGAVGLLQGAPLADRADSLFALDATRIVIEARLRLGKSADGSMPELISGFRRMCEALFGPDAIETAHAHQYAGFLARARGDDYEAQRDHFEEALHIIERLPRPAPSELATALSNLAATHHRNEAYAPAKLLLDRALDVLQAGESQDSLAIATTLINLNEARIATGDTLGVVQAYERARLLFGNRGPLVADTMRRQGLWELERGELGAATRSLELALLAHQQDQEGGEPLAETLVARAQIHLALAEADSAIARSSRARDIFERTRGSSSREVATCLLTLGHAYRRAALHELATQAYSRALVIFDASGASETEAGDCLDALVSHALELGRASDALGFARRALEVRQRARGPRHRETVLAKLALGATLRASLRSDSALVCYEDALGDLEAMHATGDAAFAEAHLRIGSLWRERYDTGRARAHVEQALRAFERVYGPGDARIATCLHELGVIQRQLGDEPSARESLERALRLASGPSANPLSAAAILGSLGALERARGDLASAESRYREARDLALRVLPANHSQHALLLRNLASLANAAGRFAEAETLYMQALEILRETSRPDDPGVAATRLGLGNALKALARPAEARAQYQAAIEIHRAALGDEAPPLALDYHNLAALQLEAGDVEAALESATRSERLSLQHFHLIASGVSEREALHYATGRVSGTDIVVSAAARSGDKVHAEAAWDLVVRSRGAVLEEVASRRQFASVVGDPAILDANALLGRASNDLAHLVVRGPGSEPVASFKRSVAEARLRKEEAERHVAQLCQPFRARRALQRVGLYEVIEHMPPRSALVAWVRFERMEAPAATEHRSAKGTPSYAAFVCDAATRTIRCIALRGATEIEELVVEWYEQAANGTRTQGRAAAEEAYRQAGDALRRAVWDPVAGAVGDVDRVYLVPDGALSLVNFEALPDSVGGFLLESAPALRLLSTERDLVRDDPLRTSGTGLLTAAAPDYDHQGDLPSSEKAGGEAGRSGDRRGVQCGQFKSLWFAPLPGAADEMESVVRLWKAFAKPATEEAIGNDAIQALVGPAATERAFKQRARGRGVIHIATHGFFLGAECAGKSAPGSASSPDELSLGSIVAESPLLLSGLAFAGANRRAQAPDSDDDGILTAEEITSLDLSGVEVAVLSACQTGLGTVEAGEGVYGLRRAFQIAGVGSLVMALWSVDDQATAEWMEIMFEKRLAGGVDTGEACRAASLEILRQRRARAATHHPYYWGAFVIIGGA